MHLKWSMLTTIWFMQNNTVCVIPSIVDGMSQCYSFDSVGDDKYIYNIKYSLQNVEQNEYYQGIVKLANKEGSVVKYIGNVALSNHSGKKMTDGGDDFRTDTFFLNLKLNLNNATICKQRVYKVMLNKLELIFKNYYSQQIQDIQ